MITSRQDTPYNFSTHAFYHNSFGTLYPQVRHRLSTASAGSSGDRRLPVIGEQ